MSLDNALRSALVREGDAISVDVGSALREIATRARSQRRRRALQAIAVALTLATVVWAPPALEAPVPDDHPRPAREPLPDRPEQRAPGDASPERTNGSGSGGRVSPSGDAERFDPRRAPSGRRAAEKQPPERGPAPDAADELGIAARQLTERYEVSYVAGTHVGENAGAGCWRGQSTTGSNDCIAIQMGDDEHEISLRLADDGGVLVGATVYHHAGGEGTELASFCGATDGYLTVEPGALLLVYVDTSARCSDDPPHSGALTASIR